MGIIQLFIILLIIMTKDEKIIFPLMCKNTDKFNKIKESFKWSLFNGIKNSLFRWIF